LNGLISYNLFNENKDFDSYNYINVPKIQIGGDKKAISMYIAETATDIIKDIDNMLELAKKLKCNIDPKALLKMKLMLQFLLNYVKELQETSNDIDLEKLHSQIKEMHTIIDKYTTTTININTTNG